MQSFKELLNFLVETEMEYKKDVSMKNLTSFKIGGISKFVVFPKNFEEIKSLIIFLKKKKVPYLFLGNGSNVLVSDKGFCGVFISSRNLNRIKILDDSLVYCESGVNLYKLCTFLKNNSFSGMEALFGIPGSLGGAIYMNAGAYGSEIKDIIDCVSYFDENEKIKKKEKNDLDFSYRHSIFEGTSNFILYAILKLEKKDKNEIEEEMNLIFKKEI